MTDNRDFDRMLSDELTQFPPERIPTGEINPWQRVSRLLVWGILLQSVTLNVFYLQYILPTIGCVLELLGFRALRRQNRSFRLGWILSVLQMVQLSASLILMATPLANSFLNSNQLPWVLIPSALCVARLFFLWRGLLETQRQGGQENPSASAAGALVIWKLLVAALALMGATSSIVSILLLAMFIPCLVSLWKLAKLFDQIGYQLHPAPPVIPDRWLAWGLPLGLLAAVLGCSIGFARLPMDWTPVEAPTQAEEEELAEIREQLLSLWENHKLYEFDNTELSAEMLEQVLLTLTPDDLRALDGAVGLVGNWEEKATPADSTFPGEFVSLAVIFPSETGIRDFIVIHYFTIDASLRSSSLRNSECIQCWPAWENSDSFQPSESLQLSGQLFFDRDGVTYASPFYSLAMEHTSYASFFEDVSADYIYATFSRPLQGDEVRGYFCYRTTQLIEEYFFDSWANYYRLPYPINYPYTTAKDYAMSGGWPTAQTALQFYS